MVRCASLDTLSSSVEEPFAGRALEGGPSESAEAARAKEVEERRRVLSAAVNATVTERDPDPAMAIARYLLQGRSITEAYPTEFQGRQLAPAERFRHPPRQ